MNDALEAARERTQRARELRDKLQAQSSRAQAEADTAHGELATCDVDSAAFAELVTRRTLALAKLDALRPRLLHARELAQDLANSLARQEASAAAPAAPRRREGISWEL